MTAQAAAILCLVLYGVSLAGTLTLSVIAALRDRKRALAVGVMGACIASGLLLVEVSRLPGVKLSSPVRSLQPSVRK